MRSLFLKIFLWFWATVIATGVTLVVTWIILQPKNAPSQAQMNLANSAWASGAAAVDLLERQGAPAASAYIEQVNQIEHLKNCLFDNLGNALAGTQCASLATVQRAMPAYSPAFSATHGFFRVAIRLRGNSGREYIFTAEMAEHHGPPPGIRHSDIALRWSVPFLVSGLICYLLTRYLTTPILRLREASQHLAAGDLSTRAAAGMEQRRDELGALVRDFNAMAGQIESLVSRQRQLICDVSHELRSPLARLNVALDLAHERKGPDSAFDHMEEDLLCLNEMIGRLLTVARLDASATAIPMAEVNLTELVSQIVRSADFELQKRGGTVLLAAQGEYLVHGNAELLHSSIENVIRNAVRYTDAGTSVDVSLEPSDSEAGACVRLAVCDHGFGVPESELGNIFQPFYRVADDRNRQSGGTGLGLAIAERVVRIHGGTIRARNALPQGLEVEMLLPRRTA